MEEMLLISPDHPPMQGGIARVAEYFCRFMGEHKVRVLAPQHPSAEPEPNVVRLPLSRTENPLKNIFYLLCWLRAAQREIKKHSIKKVMVGLLSPLGILGLILRYSAGQSYFIFAHASEVPTEKDSWWRRFLARLIYEKSSHVICSSQYAMARVKENAPSAKCTIVYLGVDIQKFKRAPKRNDLVSRYHLTNKKVFLCLGRLVRRKGYDRALEAFQKVLSVHKEAALLIAGEGPDKDFLVSLANQLGILSSVHFVGFLSEESLVDFYQLADVFLFLSRAEEGDAEGFGLVILEAFSCGCPVIGGKSGAIPEVIRQGVTGVLVNPENVQEISSTMLQLIQDENLLKKYSDSAYAYAQTQSWNMVGKRWLDIMEKYGGDKSC